MYVKDPFPRRGAFMKKVRRAHLVCVELLQAALQAFEDFAHVNADIFDSDEGL